MIKISWLNIFFVCSIALVHFRSYFFRAASSSGVANAAKVVTRGRCPFSAARQFLGQPTALFANSLMIPVPHMSSVPSVQMSLDYHGFKHSRRIPSTSTTALHFRTSCGDFDSFCHSTGTKLLAKSTAEPTYTQPIATDSSVDNAEPGKVRVKPLNPVVCISLLMKFALFF